MVQNLVMIGQGQLTGAPGRRLDLDSFTTNGTGDGTAADPVIINGGGLMTLSLYNDFYVSRRILITSGAGEGDLYDCFHVDSTLGQVGGYNSAHVSFVSAATSTTVFAGNTTNSVLVGGLSATDDFYNDDHWVRFVTGPNAGAFQKVTDYTGNTRSFTTAAFDNQPTVGDKFVVEKFVTIDNVDIVVPESEWLLVSKDRTAKTAPSSGDTYQIQPQGDAADPPAAVSSLEDGVGEYKTVMSLNFGTASTGGMGSQLRFNFATGFSVIAPSESVPVRDKVLIEHLQVYTSLGYYLNEQWSIPSFDADIKLIWNDNPFSNPPYLPVRTNRPASGPTGFEDSLFFTRWRMVVDGVVHHKYNNMLCSSRLQVPVKGIEGDLIGKKFQNPLLGFERDLTVPNMLPRPIVLSGGQTWEIQMMLNRTHFANEYDIVATGLLLD
jgi:acid phosphatase family membrane protein YuiD